MIKPVLLFSDKHRHIFKYFYIIIPEKNSSNVHVIPYVDLLQYLSNGQNEQHRNSKLSKEDMKQTSTFTVSL